MKRAKSMNLVSMKWSPIVLFALILLSWSQTSAETLEPASFPSLVSSTNVTNPLEFCNEAVPTESQEIRERLEKELLLTLWNRPQVILWLKRSNRYFPIIEKMLRESGMPDDLKYVAIAESALRPHATSKKGAVGFWQFIKRTGRKYDLNINRRIDERRNIFASTQAAIRYFGELYEIFGSWTLAAAAYNMGEERLKAETLKQGNNTYYHLYLPLETQRYIFRILSVKLFFSDPGKYGFNLSEDDYYPPLEFDRVRIDCPQDTPIRIIAHAANTHFKAIKDLNPEIRGHHLPEGSHELLIPNDASNSFNVRYQHLLKHWLAKRNGRTYDIEGNSLAAVANPNKPLHRNDLKTDEINEHASSAATRRNRYSGGNVAKKLLSPASKILAIQPVTSNDDLVFLITGNGSLDNYDALILTDPPRLVLDLFGVQSTEVKDIMNLNGSLVEKVRVGIHGDKVRVVFDLLLNSEAGVPHRVFSRDDRLVVSFKAAKKLEPR